MSAREIEQMVQRIRERRNEKLRTMIHSWAAQAA